jgi:hypothetical protein
MFYDRSATKTAIERAGLTARSQKFVAGWLAAWQGSRLPTPAVFCPARLRRLKSLIQICTVNPKIEVQVIFEGEDIARILGMSLKDVDWFSLVPATELAERMMRTVVVTEGALLRTVRNVQLKRGKRYVFETISVPLRPDDTGTAQIVTFFDWHPPSRSAVLLNIGEMTAAPALAQFISIVRSASPSRVASRQELNGAERAKIISYAALRLVMNLMGEAMKSYVAAGLDPTDYLIATAIELQNVSHIEDDANISRHYASLTEENWMRKGISRAAVARATHIPLETVRRRINRLIAMGILIERKDGIIASGRDLLDPASRSSHIRFRAKLMEQLISDLEVRGISFH